MSYIFYLTLNFTLWGEKNAVGMQLLPAFCVKEAVSLPSATLSVVVNL